MRILKCLVPLALLAPLAASAQVAEVRPHSETQPGTQTLGAQSVDVALWPHPTDPAQSLLLVADNATGLIPYTLQGSELTATSSGGVLSGVDVQEGVAVAGAVQPLVMAASRSLNGLVAFVVDPQTRALRRADDQVLRVSNFSPESVTLYRSASTGTVYAFTGNNVGSAPAVVQLELSASLDGGVSGSVVRTISLPQGSLPTALIADDEQGVVFITDRDRGVLRISAEPNGGTVPAPVASATVGGALSAPVNGLALYRVAGGGGYLIVANTALNAFNVYQRQSPHNLVGSFRVVQDGGIDAVNGPRSLELTSRPLGALFPQGLLVAHDGANESVENYKLVSWPNLANAFSPPLVIGAPSTDGGTADGGEDGGTTGPPGGPSGPSLPLDDPSASCNCATASVPGTVLLALAGLVLRGRRRGR